MADPIAEYQAAREAYYRANGQAGDPIGRVAGRGEVFAKSFAEGVTLGHYQSDLPPSSREEHPVSGFAGQMAGGLVPVVVGGGIASATGPFSPLTMQALGTGLGAARPAATGEERAANVMHETGLFTLFEGAPRVRLGSTPTRQVLGETAAIGAGATGMGIAAGEQPEEALLSGGIMAGAHGILRGGRAIREQRGERPEPVRTEQPTNLRTVQGEATFDPNIAARQNPLGYDARMGTPQAPNVEAIRTEGEVRPLRSQEVPEIRTETVQEPRLLSDEVKENKAVWESAKNDYQYISRDGKEVGFVGKRDGKDTLFIIDNAGPARHSVLGEGGVEEALRLERMVPRGTSKITVTGGLGEPSANYGGFGWKPALSRGGKVWYGPSEHLQWFKTRLESGGYSVEVKDILPTDKISTTPAERTETAPAARSPEIRPEVPVEPVRPLGAKVEEPRGTAVPESRAPVEGQVVQVDRVLAEEPRDTGAGKEAQGVAKEPWEMTREEYGASVGASKPHIELFSEISPAQATGMSKAAINRYAKGRAAKKTEARDNYRNASEKWESEVKNAYDDGKYTLREAYEAQDFSRTNLGGEDFAFDVITDHIRKSGLDVESPFKIDRMSPKERSSYLDKIDAEYRAGSSPQIERVPADVAARPEQQAMREVTSEREVMLSTKSVKTDPQRFQNRKKAYSEESVQRITDNYDPAKMDAIVVWKDPSSGETYVLSGHSRYEAMRRMGKENIPARYFSGTEKAAKDFSRIEANRGATRETLIEDLQAYERAQKRGYTKARLGNTFGTDRVAYLEAYRHLNRKGEWIRQLEAGGEGFPYIKRFARWVGELRKEYGDRFTNAHESELWDYFYNSKNAVKNRGILRDDLFAFVDDKVRQFGFDPKKEPLAIESRRYVTGARARADLAPTYDKITELKNRRRTAKTEGEKEALTEEILKLEQQIELHGSKQEGLALDLFAASKFEDILPDLREPVRAAWRSMDATIKKALVDVKVNAANFSKRLHQFVTGAIDKIKQSKLWTALSRAHEYLKAQGFYDKLKLQKRKGSIRIPGKKSARDIEAQERRETQFRERTKPPEPDEPLVENMKMISEKQLNQLRHRMGTKVSWKQLRESSQQYFSADVESLSMAEASALVKHLKGGNPPMYKQVRDVHDEFVKKGFTHSEIHDAAVLKFGVESLTSLRAEDAPLLRQHMEAKYQAKKAYAQSSEETLKGAAKAADSVKKGATGLSRWYSDHLLEARARIRKTVTGVAEALKMDRVHRFGQELKVTARYKWETAIHETKPNRAERNWARENWKKYVESAGKMDLPEGVSRTKMETLRKTWREIAEIFAVTAEELGVKGFQRVKGEYWMHWLTPEAKEALFYGEGPLYEALYEAVKLKPWAQYEGWSKFRNRVKQGKVGSLEEQRVIEDMPEVLTVNGKEVRILQADPFDVIPRYIDMASKRLGFIREYGQGAKADTHMNAAMDAIRAEAHRGGRNGEADAKFYQQVMEELQGIDKTPPPKGAGKLLFAGQNIARANHLTFAQITNFVLGSVPAMVKYGPRETLRAMWRTMGDAQYREMLRQHGGWMYDSWSSMRDVADFMGKTGELSRKALKYTGFEFANRWVNMVSSAAALEHFSAALKVKSWTKLRMLEQEYGFTKAEIESAIRRGEFTAAEKTSIAERAKALANVTDMSALDTQPWAKTPTARFMLAYLSPVMRLGNVLSYAVSEARLNNNWTPLVTHLAGGVIAADLNRRIKDWLRMKDRNDETFLSRLYVDLLYSSAFGMPGEAAQRLYFAKKYDQSVISAPVPEFFMEFYTEFPDVPRAFLNNNPAAKAFAVRTGLVDK